jgi:hypothetical protein
MSERIADGCIHGAVLGRCAFCERDSLRDSLTVATARIAELEAELRREKYSHAFTIDQRDRAEEAADKLAYAIGSVEEIGEHSNLNCPWKNASELLETQKKSREGEIERLKAETVDALDRACKQRDAALALAERRREVLESAREPFGNVLSKLESQIVRNPDLPEAYKTILKAGYDFLNGPLFAAALRGEPVPSECKHEWEDVRYGMYDRRRCRKCQQVLCDG